MVIFVAVPTRQIAPAHRNKVSEHRVTAGQKCPAYEACFTKFKLEKFSLSHSHSDNSTSDFPALKNMRQENRRQEGPLICLRKAKGALVHYDESPSGLFNNPETSAFNP